MAAPPDSDLLRLGEFARAWVRGWAATAGASAAVPPGIAELVVSRPALRSVALEDAALLLRLPPPFGLGLEVTITACEDEGPWEGYPRCFRGIVATFSYATEMSGLSVETRDVTFSRVVEEADQLRVAELLTGPERTQLHSFVALLNRHR